MSTQRLADALRFYADPESYFGIGFFTDPPCGNFANDCNEVADATGYVYMRPGKLARAALTAHEAEKAGPDERICHAPGEKCCGCPHYYGRAASCVYKDAAPAQPPAPEPQGAWKYSASIPISAVQLALSNLYDAGHDEAWWPEGAAAGKWAAVENAYAAIAALRQPVTDHGEFHGLDTADFVCFYEQDFYVLSNFSSFRVHVFGESFDTSEAAYHWGKFPDRPDIRNAIMSAASAHEAFKIAERHKADRRPDWDDVKRDFMLEVLRSKVNQHEYVRRKLLATGDRILVENSWRDDVWGWGPNRDGQNLLGKLWMEIRAELRGIPVVESDGGGT